MTLGPRLFASFLLVIGVGLLTATIALSSLLSSYEKDVTRARLQDIAAPFMITVQNGFRDFRRPATVVDSLAEQARAAGARLIILDAQRRAIIDSDARIIEQRLPPVAPAGLGTFRDGGEEWLFVQETLRPPAGGAVLVVARPRSAFTDTLRGLAGPLIASGITAAIVALAAAAVLAGTISRPLRALALSTRRFAAHDYDTRVAEEGPPETRQLGTAFNEMAAEIGRARGSEQAFLADISHELRTPLTSIHGFAQAITDGTARGAEVEHAAQIIQREARRLVRMVEGLLEVARLQAGTLDLAREPIDMRRSLGNAVDALTVQAKDAGVTIDLQTDALPIIHGDADRITQLLVNVIDNAVRHTPRGSAVAVRATQDAGIVIVRVRDAGSGFAPDAEGKLFERFWRGESAAPGGAGLGLAIARAITEAHGGGISAANAPDGGAEFTIRLT